MLIRYIIAAIISLCIFGLIFFTKLIPIIHWTAVDSMSITMAGLMALPPFIIGGLTIKKIIDSKIK